MPDPDYFWTTFIYLFLFILVALVFELGALYLQGLTLARQVLLL
jgi:hypothetical protein